MTRYPRGMRRLTLQEENEFWDTFTSDLETSEHEKAPLWFRYLLIGLSIVMLLILYAMVPPAEPQHAPLMVDGFESSGR